MGRNRGRGFPDKADHQQCPGDDQAEPGDDMGEFYDEFLSGSSAGGAGLGGGDGKDLSGAPPGVGDFGKKHEPHKPNGKDDHRDGLRPDAVGKLEKDEGEDENEHAVDFEFGVSDQSEPGIGSMGDNKTPEKADEDEGHAVEEDLAAGGLNGHWENVTNCREIRNIAPEHSTA